MIGAGGGGEPSLSSGALFGVAVASLGDLDGDGVFDLAVGSQDVDSQHGISRGEVLVMFMNVDGSVRSHQRITDAVNGGPVLPPSNRFGSAIAPIGDLDGDGVSEIAVGDELDSTGGPNRGAVYVLFMNTDGTVKSSQKIASEIGGDPLLDNSAFFGGAVTALGDLDGDGLNDMAVGAPGDSTGGIRRGAVYVLLMNADGTVKSSQKIASGTGGGPLLVNGDDFGTSVTALGDLNGDGVGEIAVGAAGDDTGGSNTGAVYVLFMNTSGTAWNTRKIGFGGQNLPRLERQDFFGISVAALSDLDGNGVNELAVGAIGDDTGSVGHDLDHRGAVHVLFLDADGTVSGWRTIGHHTGGGPFVGLSDFFGYSTASLGDLDRDGVIDLVVGAQLNDTGSHGVVHFLPLQHENQFAPQFTSPDTAIVAENTTAVMTVTAVDADTPAQPLTFSITGGADRSRFEITAGGELSFVRPQDFEAPTDADRDNVYDLLIEASDGNGGTTTETLIVTVTDVPDPPSVDFGDAPDLVNGTGPGDYQTLSADNGPQHTIMVGLRLGSHVDGDSGALQNAGANEDDVNAALPDDEDGVVNPASDLVLTVGTRPTVSLWVTNTTATAASLYGWIDYNANGVFDNGSERALAAVADGTNNSIVTLVFPPVPGGFTGTTYARFRLSTDAAAANSTGAAADGEVEDYRVTIHARGDGRADSAKSKTIDNFYAEAIAGLGDLDGDGVRDVAIVGYNFDTGEDGVFVLFMNIDGTVKSNQRIASGVGGMPTLVNGDGFEPSLTSLGDLDGDGVHDLAVAGVSEDRGSIYLLFLNTDGTVKGHKTIVSEVGGAPSFGGFEYSGGSLSSLGDLDGDGVSDLAVGASGYEEEDAEGGAVHVVFLNADGTVKRYQTIASEIGGGPTLSSRDYFGTSLASLGDIDGDGIGDLVVGAVNDFDDSDPDFEVNFEYAGVVYVLLLNADGTVKQSQKIGNGVGGGPLLSDYDQFGNSIASLGDIDGDGITDIAVGAPDSGGGETYDGGFVYVLLLNADGTAKTRWKIGDNTNGGPPLDDYSRFGSVVASPGDLDGDGVVDLVVQANGGYNGDGGADLPSVLHVLYLRPETPDYGNAPDAEAGSGPGQLSNACRRQRAEPFDRGRLAAWGSRRRRQRLIREPARPTPMMVMVQRRATKTGLLARDPICN